MESIIKIVFELVDSVSLFPSKRLGISFDDLLLISFLLQFKLFNTLKFLNLLVKDLKHFFHFRDGLLDWE